MILSIGNKLVLIQCRLWEKPVDATKWKKDVKNLKKFRDKLWNVDNKETTPPVGARKLGIPAICEEDVVFVMMSPNGVTQSVHDADDASEGDSFRGTFKTRNSVYVDVTDSRE